MGMALPCTSTVTYLILTQLQIISIATTMEQQFRENLTPLLQADAGETVLSMALAQTKTLSSTSRSSL